MRLILNLLVLFALAVGVAWLFQQNTGYIVVFAPPYRMELQLNLVLVLAVLLLLAMYALLRFWLWASCLPDQVRRRRAEKKAEHARQALRQAFLYYMEGRYQRAEREAMRANDVLDSDEDHVLSRLLAAKSAHEMHDFAGRDEHLAALDALGEFGQLARDLQQARMLFDEKRLDEALACLQNVRQSAPSLTAALKLELKIQTLKQAPEAMLNLLERLQKSDGLSREQADMYRRAAWRLQLPHFYEASAILAWWRHLPDQARSHPDILLPVAEQCLQLSAADDAAVLLVESLENTWSREALQKLGESVGLLSQDAALTLAVRADQWLDAHRKDPDLLLLLGRLASAQQLWGKAQSYLEASLSVQPSFAAHFALARLFWQLERRQDAEKHEAAALKLAAKAQGFLPRTLAP